MKESKPRSNENNELNPEKRENVHVYFPDQVSEKFLGNLVGKSILDVGVGSDEELQKYVEEHGGSYKGIDTNEEFLKKRKRGNWEEGRAEQLRFPDDSFHIVHSRFMLRHLTSKQRERAISEMYRVGQEVLLLDYDWEALERTIQEHIKETIDNPTAQRILDLQKTWIRVLRSWTPAKEMDMAIKTRTEVERVLGISAHEYREQRPLPINDKEVAELEREFVKKLGGGAVMREWKALNAELRIPIMMPDMIVISFKK